MTNKNCLNEQDLILLYYEELPAAGKEVLHLANCLVCRQRLQALSDDLSDLPMMTQEVDSHAGTRMAARVTEQLKRPRWKWLPVIGTSAVAALAIVLTISFWNPQQELHQTASNGSQLTTDLDEEMPDIDFLDDLEILKELELLSQIEGV